ncbi:hypothetical protein C9374_001362 [Naegleria lovaniensis]|uniref:J domain-containing protein n=1 Tax=Naegleria lovaniensis TaxID=51637 RepID=A0AA88GWR2_NAELO|nr:uncharacterized protein C9374_001362 [Naegleria lovaniensis]KAG2387768.1 hypothetical protein C9374_001362 [Naegleria lovaniensis]
MFFKTSRLHLQAVSSSHHNLYQVLGVSRTSSPKQIKQAFLQLVKQHHPDNKNGDEELFKQVNDAYKTLSDPLKRAEYDAEMRNKERHEELLKHQREFEHHRSEQTNQRIRTIHLSEEEKKKFVESLAKRKKEDMEALRRSHEAMFVEMRKHKKSPLKFILLIVGAVFMLWGVKLTMWYNSVYKNYKSQEEIIDVVHPMANDKEADSQKRSQVPEQVRQLLIQNQSRAYVDTKYYKQSPPNH